MEWNKGITGNEGIPGKEERLKGKDVTIKKRFQLQRNAGK